MDAKSEMKAVASTNDIKDPLEVQETPDQATALKQAEWSTEAAGEAKTESFRLFCLQHGAKASFWHDVPLRAASGNFNAVIEIPKMTTAKFEMATKEAKSPIKQDVKKGKLRDYAIPIEWNYGAMPQTWEEPDHVTKGMEGCKGDDDPLDVVDLSTIVVASGSIIEVKPVAVLAMIDEGEVDWKVIVINAADPKASVINSLEDAEAHFPGQVARVREWFTWYKAVDGKPGDGPLNSNKKDDAEPNVFGFDGAALPASRALEIIEETHASWAKLKSGAVPAGKLQLE